MQSNHNPLITVITATYNSEDVIERCINGVINQVYNNIEYIIIDGNSSDNTIAIIEKYHENIKKWVSEPDSGVYDAWNKGLNMSHGEWITFVGSDDVLYPDAIQNYVDFINKSELKFDFICSRAHVVNHNGKILRTLGWPWDWKISKKFNTIAHPGSLHSKELFEKLGRYDTNYKIVGDYELMLRGGANLRAGFMDKVTLKMQIGGLSDSYRMYFEHFKAVTQTGDLNFANASYHFVKEYSKFLIRRLFRLVGVSIALKK